MAEATHYSQSSGAAAAVDALDTAEARPHPPRSNRAGKGAIPLAFCVRLRLLLLPLPYSPHHCRFHPRQISAPWHLQIHDKGSVLCVCVVGVCGVCVRGCFAVVVLSCLFVCCAGASRFAEKWGSYFVAYFTSGAFGCTGARGKALEKHNQVPDVCLCCLSSVACAFISVGATTTTEERHGGRGRRLKAGGFLGMGKRIRGRRKLIFKH